MSTYLPFKGLEVIVLQENRFRFSLSGPFLRMAVVMKKSGWWWFSESQAFLCMYLSETISVTVYDLDYVFLEDLYPISYETNFLDLKLQLNL